MELEKAAPSIAANGYRHYLTPLVGDGEKVDIPSCSLAETRAGKLDGLLLHRNGRRQWQYPWRMGRVDAGHSNAASTEEPLKLHQKD